MVNIRIFLGVAALLMASSTIYGQSALAPVPPRDLLKAMPPTPKGWTLRESNASHTKTNPPNSKATRVYAFYDPAGGAPTPQTVPLRTVSITVRDACGDQAVIDTYAETEKGTPAETARAGDWVTFGSVRAVRTKVEKESDHLEMLLQKRFQVIYVVVNGPAPVVPPGALAGQSPIAAEERPEQWLAGINLTMLSQAAASAGKLDTLKGYVFNVERVDEINPKRNKIIKANMGGSEVLPFVPGPEVEPGAN